MKRSVCSAVAASFVSLLRRSEAPDDNLPLPVIAGYAKAGGRKTGCLLLAEFAVLAFAYAQMAVAATTFPAPDAVPPTWMLEA